MTIVLGDAALRCIQGFGLKSGCGDNSGVKDKMGGWPMERKHALSATTFTALLIIFSSAMAGGGELLYLSESVDGGVSNLYSVNLSTAPNPNDNKASLLNF